MKLEDVAPQIPHNNPRKIGDRVQFVEYRDYGLDPKTRKQDIRRVERFGEIVGATTSTVRVKTDEGTVVVLYKEEAKIIHRPD